MFFGERRKAALLVLLLVGVFIFNGCKKTTEISEKQSKEIIVFAAASTTDAVKDIAKAFTDNTGINVTLNFASSSALAQQINTGAEVDVYISANQKWADFLDENGYSGERITLLGNRIVIVVPANSSLAGDSPDVLLDDTVETIAMGETSSVPVGKYGKEALTTLGYWEKIKDKVTGAKDVRSALAYVETQAAEAGIVYSTDAAISENVKVIYTFAEDSTAKPISYPAMIVNNPVHPDEAMQFYAFLQSDAADEVFEHYGFIVK